MAGIAGLLRAIVIGRENGWRARARGRSSGRATEQSTPPEPSVPAGMTEVLKSDELSEGEVIEVFVDGNPVALCRADGVVYAVHGLCPHAQGPLGDGQLNGTTLTCPVHGWSFDVRDGSCGVDPSKPVQPLAVVEQSGRIAVGQQTG